MMKLISLLGLGLLFWTCEGEDSEIGELSGEYELESTASLVMGLDHDTTTYIPLYIHDIPAAGELNSFTTTLGSCAQPVIPTLDRQRAIMLTRSYWVVEGYADSEASRAQRIAATGQWLRCMPDGTFTAGHWARQTHFGTWYLNYSGKGARLTLDSNVDRMDAVWEMQAVAGDETAMAWNRVADANFGPYHRPFSIKLIELYDRPTKEQFKGMLR